jgi:Tfp pilus assembly protein PilX
MTVRFPIRIRIHRAGVALVLVVFVMALAAILGYAMLSASAVQATASGNGVAAAIARAQAESGIHLAMYYLQNPGNAPSSPPCTWSNVTFATTQPAETIPGSVTIQVGPEENNCYQIISTGSSGSSTGGGAVTRTITVEVQVGSPLPINEAGAFNGNVTVGLNSSYTSATANAPAIIATGGVTNSGTINGNIVASSVSGGGTFSNPTPIGTASMPPAPSSATNVTSYTQYMYQGVLESAQPFGQAQNPITNPLGVFYSSGNLTVSSATTITGTLIVEGNLTLSNNLTITPIASTLSTNMPALVISGKITLDGANSNLNATGVVYLGGQITGLGSTSTSNITVNGALMVTPATPVQGYSGSINVTYNPAYTNIPSFDVTDWDSSAGVKIISWSE